MCMVLRVSDAWCFVFFSFFVPFLPHLLPPASPSCPFPPSPTPYWEVFHEQLGPRRGEVSERGALCIIQWLSGACTGVCVRVCVGAVIYVLCVCVWASPFLLAGVRWQAGHGSGCQLALYWSSHTVRNITISWWGRLGMSHKRLGLCLRHSSCISTDIFSFSQPCVLIWLKTSIVS